MELNPEQVRFEAGEVYLLVVGRGGEEVQIPLRETQWRQLERTHVLPSKDTQHGGSSTVMLDCRAARLQARDVEHYFRDCVVGQSQGQLLMMAKV
jgi:hypothetical protein